MKNFLSIITGLVLVLLSCATFKSSTSFDLSKAATSNFLYKDFKYELLKNNDKIKVKFSSDAYKFDFGKSYYAMYKLPDREDDYNILLISYPFHSKLDDRNAESFIFYPIVKVLDSQFNFKRNIITKIKKKSPLSGVHEHKILIKKNDSYVIIHTDSTLLDKYITEIIESSKIIFFAGEKISKPSKTKFAPIGEVEILTPFKNYKDVLIPPSRLLLELGVCGGGDRVASAADEGNDIYAGSLFMLSLGYSFRFPFTPRFTLRTIGGYRYNTGETEYGLSEIKAFTGEIIGVYSLNRLNLGIGYCSHIAPKFSAKDLANNISFKNAFGPVIIIELYSNIVNYTIGAKCILMDYVKKSNAEKINAFQLGIYMDFYFTDSLLKLFTKTTR